MTLRKSPSGVRVGIDDGAPAAAYVGGVSEQTVLPNVAGTTAAAFVAGGRKVAEEEFTIPKGASAIFSIRDVSPTSGTTATRVTTMELAGDDGVYGAPVTLIQTASQAISKNFVLPVGRVRIRTYIGFTNATGYAGITTTYGEETSGHVVSGVVLSDL